MYVYVTVHVYPEAPPTQEHLLPSVNLQHHVDQTISVTVWFINYSESAAATLCIAGTTALLSACKAKCLTCFVHIYDIPEKKIQ